MHVAYVLQSLPLKGPWPQPGRKLNAGGFLELLMATQQVSQLTLSPRPQVTNSRHLFASTGFLGMGPKQMVITTTVRNTGSAGMVQVSATAKWTNGGRTGTTQEYFSQGQQQDVKVHLVNIPREARHAVSATPMR